MTETIVGKHLFHFDVPSANMEGVEFMSSIAASHQGAALSDSIDRSADI